MAKVTNAFSTYGAKGNREDLSDAIVALDPTATPFMSAIGRKSASQPIFQWQVDSLRTQNINNAVEEGYLLAPRATVSTTMRSNVTQIAIADATVSSTQEVTKTAGRPSEMAYQMAKAAKELKRDIEGILLSNQARNDGNDSGTARRTEGLEHAITTNVASGTGYVAPASQTAAGTDGTARAFAKNLLDDVLQSAFTNAGEVPDTMLLPPGQKRVFSGFANRAGLTLGGNAKTNEIVGAADLYQSDWGVIKAVPSALMPRTRTVLIVNPDYAAVRYLGGGFKTDDMAKTGLATTKLISVEFGLEIGNEKAHGKVADLT